MGFKVSAKDLCRIIKACAHNKVKEVRVNGLHLVFGSETQSESNTLGIDPPRSVEQASEKIAEESLSKDRLDALQLDLEEIKITDPLAYERLIGGELGDVNSP